MNRNGSRIGRERRSMTKAVTEPSAADIAWAAGFIEGEGSIHCSGCEQLRATQVELGPLEKLQRLFGGSIRHHSRRTSVWSVYGWRARGVMLAIFIFMSFRRRQQIQDALLLSRSSRRRFPLLRNNSGYTTG